MPALRDLSSSDTTSVSSEDEGEFEDLSAIDRRPPGTATKIPNTGTTATTTTTTTKPTTAEDNATVDVNVDIDVDVDADVDVDVEASALTMPATAATGPTESSGSTAPGATTPTLLSGVQPSCIISTAGLGSLPVVVGEGEGEGSVCSDDLGDADLFGFSDDEKPQNDGVCPPAPRKATDEAFLPADEMHDAPWSAAAGLTDKTPKEGTNCAFAPPAFGSDSQHQYLNPLRAEENEEKEHSTAVVERETGANGEDGDGSSPAMEIDELDGDVDDDGDDEEEDTEGSRGFIGYAKLRGHRTHKYSNNLGEESENDDDNDNENEDGNDDEQASDKLRGVGYEASSIGHHETCDLPRIPAHRQTFFVEVPNSLRVEACPFDAEIFTTLDAEKVEPAELRLAVEDTMRWRLVLTNVVEKRSDNHNQEDNDDYEDEDEDDGDEKVNNNSTKKSDFPSCSTPIGIKKHIIDSVGQGVPKSSLIDQNSIPDAIAIASTGTAQEPDDFRLGAAEGPSSSATKTNFVSRKRRRRLPQGRQQSSTTNCDDGLPSGDTATTSCLGTQANAQLVIWDDGRMSLLVGDELFDAMRVPVPVGTAGVFAVNHEHNMLAGECGVTEKLMFQPCDVSNRAHQKMADMLLRKFKRTQCTKIVSIDRDPDVARLERIREEKDCARINQHGGLTRRRQKKNRTGFSASRLDGDNYDREDDDDDDDNDLDYDYDYDYEDDGSEDDGADNNDYGGSDGSDGGGAGNGGDLGSIVGFGGGFKDINGVERKNLGDKRRNTRSAGCGLGQGRGKPRQKIPSPSWGSGDRTYPTTDEEERYREQRLLATRTKTVVPLAYPGENDDDHNGGSGGKDADNSGRRAFDARLAAGRGRRAPIDDDDEIV